MAVYQQYSLQKYKEKTLQIKVNQDNNHRLRI
jgi:hypothetical protein